MEPSIAGYLLPSKTFYYLSAGSALLAILPPNNEVADLISNYEIGIRVDPNDTQMLVNSILHLHSNKVLCSHYQSSARKLSVSKFSRNNTSIFINSLRHSLR